MIRQRRRRIEKGLKQFHVIPINVLRIFKFICKILRLMRRRISSIALDSRSLDLLTSDLAKIECLCDFAAFISLIFNCSRLKKVISCLRMTEKKMMLCIYRFASFLFTFVIVIISGQYSQGAGSSISTCRISNCGLKTPPEIATKIQACEINMASNHCDSLGPNVKLRDCKTEAFCPNSIDNNYVLGCLIGSAHFAGDIVKGVVLAPINIFKNAINQTTYETKYFSPYVYEACTDAEKAVKSGAVPGDKLDCDATFWSRACPRTILNNCKNQILSEFPDIKEGYGDKFTSISYDQVVKDVHARLNEIAVTKPSLWKFLDEHKGNEAQAVSDLVVGQLRKEGYRLECMSPKDFSDFSCDVILNAFTVAKAGLSLAGKIAKGSETLSVISSENSLAKDLTKPNLMAPQIKGVVGSKITDMSQLPFSVKPGSEVYQLGVDTGNSKAQIYRVTEDSGSKNSKTFMYKNYADKENALDDDTKLQFLYQVSMKPGYTGLKITKPIRLDGNVLVSENQFGQNLEKVLQSPDISPAVKHALQEKYDKLLENTINALKKEDPSAHELITHDGYGVPDPRGSIHFNPHTADLPNSRLYDGFWLKPDNVIVNPNTLEMTVIDPY